MTTAIENVRVFDGSVVSEPLRVVFGESVLADDTAAADTVVDAAGGVLLPGLPGRARAHRARPGRSRGPRSLGRHDGAGHGRLAARVRR